MMKNKLLKIFLIVFILNSLFLLSQRTIAVTGNNWTVPIASITEAGANYPGTYESAANQILIAATIPALLGNGKVSVRYEANPTWNSNLGLNIRRTGNGTTSCLLCALTLGETYQPLTTTDMEFFRLATVLTLVSYSNIPIQLQLTGVSVTIPAATYNSRVVFTISAL